MWQTRKSASRLAAVGVVILAAAGCGGPSASGGSHGDGRLTVGLAAIPTTLDPGQNFLRQQFGIMQLTAGTLTEPESDGTVRMGLAQSVDPGPDRYVVKLKPGLKFSDGSPLTASDVAASFAYYLNDKTNGYAYTFAPIEKVTAVDSLTVQFDLRQPFPSLPTMLSYPTSAILPSTVIASRGTNLYTGAPLPTAGPFRVESSDQKQIILQANPNYAGPRPSTKTVAFEKITDTAARLAQVQGGQIDYADDISPQQVAQLSRPVEARTVSASLGVIYLVMNNRTNSVLSDVRIRQAIASAINRDQVNEIAYAGKSKPALGLLGSSAKENNAFLSAKPDVEHATQLLQGTKCANGCDMVLIAQNDDEARTGIATVVRENLKAIGIGVKIEMAEAGALDQRASNGDYDLRIGGNYDQPGYPDGFLAWTLGPSSKALRSGYKSPEMERLIDQVGVTDGSARQAAINQINTLFQKDMPMAPVVDYSVVSASRVPSELFDVSSTFYYHVG